MMKDEMKKLIKDLATLLNHHDATIVRSGDDNHKLVLCINNDETCQEEEFEEEYENVRIVILNVTGQEVFTAEYSNQTKIELNIEKHF